MESMGKNFFDKYNISYKPQYTFSDLRGVNGYVLRFDFAILKDGELDSLIEFDGEHHFEVINAHGGLQKHLITVEHDNRKNEYCKNKSIKLYRISHKENTEEVLSSIFLEKDNPVPSLHQ
jgi:hypothetical protein